LLLPFDISADVLGKSGLCPPADNVRLVGQGTFQPPGPELGMKAGCRARSNNIDTAIAEAKFGIFEIARQKGPSEAKSFRAHLRYAVVPPLVWTRGWRSMMLLDRAECSPLDAVTPSRIGVADDFVVAHIGIVAEAPEALRGARVCTRCPTSWASFETAR